MNNYAFSGPTAAVGAGIFFIVLAVLIGILATGFWIWMLVDSAMNPALTDIQKVIWVLIIILVHPLLGAIIYYFVGRPKRNLSP